MIVFDTNHLLRHVLQDDQKQCAQIAGLMELAETADQKIHLLDLVLMEACWVLQSSMGFDREGWSHILYNLLQDPIFSYDDSSRLWRTLERYRNGKADFDDYLILGHSESIGAKLQTFDKKLKKGI